MEEEINQEFNNQFKKILIIAIVVIIIIIFITVLLTIFKGKPEIPRGNSGTTPLKNSLEEKLKNCLEKDDFNADCEILFSSPDIDKDCEKLSKEEIRDKCFYKIALANYNDLYCQSIENEGLREDCGVTLTPSMDYGLQ